MTGIRWIVYGLPSLLAALIVIAFANESLLSSKKKNEMSIGIGGEPTTLNPIKATDASANDVDTEIFNGLLKYDENLEIAGDLAKSWSLSQTTTVVFVSDAAAQAALGIIQGKAALWGGWHLESARVDGSHLILLLSQPGMADSQAITALLDKATIRPVLVHRVEVKDSAGKIADDIVRAHPEAGVFRAWVDSDTSFELCAAEDMGGVLQGYFGEHPGAEGKGKVTATQDFLAEPAVDFVLRDDVRWQDGEPFTSHDVLFTYNALMDDAVGSPRKSDFELITKVETPDRFRVHVEYRKPFSPALASWTMSILPAHILEGKSQDWWTANYDRKPIGTGPFKFDQWKTNEFIRLAHNPVYFNAPAPWLDGVVFHILPDQLALRLAFETRQVDFWDSDPWAAASFTDNPRFTVFSSPANEYTYIGWNLRRPVFQDVRVRQALACAVNVPEMVKYILYGQGIQSAGIFTPQMWFFDPHVPLLRYDPAGARKLLDEAGWKPGPDGIRTRNGQRLAFTLITGSGNEIRRDIATLVQDDLKKVGVEVKIETYEWAVFIQNHILKQDFDATVLGWTTGIDFDVYQVWHSSQTGPGHLNLVGYKSPEADHLIESLRQEYDRDKIITMSGALQDLIYHDQPYLFLYVPRSVSILWKDSYRIRKPDGHGGWSDVPVGMTKAGWQYWLDWFYRPDLASQH